MKRYVTLGDGRRVGLGTYVKAWRSVLDAGDKAIIAGSPRDPRRSCSREEALHEFREGMDDRINRHIPGFGVGRKWEPNWFWAAWRAARDVNTPRLIVRYVPPDLKARLAHRIHTNEDL
jgi:hypothetical protein